MYYKWIDDTIFALYPWGMDNFHKGWHIVLFNRWFRLFDEDKLDKKWQTSFSYMPDHQAFAFTRYWGPNLEKSDATTDDFEPIYWYFKCINAPWAKFLYKEQVLKGKKWITFEGLRSDAEKIGDVFETTFKFFENDKRVIVKAKVLATKSFYGIHWFPKFLKPLFHETVTDCWVEFSTGIGKDRGSWKGGTVGMHIPFKKDLKTSWTEFEYTGLQKMLKEQQR